MTDQVEHRQEQHRFVVEGEAGEAEMTYRVAARTMVVDHTGVPPAMQHRGVANLLAEAALAYARREGLKVDPQCRFMAVYLKRHREHRDLLAHTADGTAGADGDRT